MKTTRILTAVAAASVILNLLLVGFVVGQRLPHWSDQPRMMQMRQMDRVRGMPIGPNDLNIFAAMRALDPESRQSVRAAFNQHLPDIRAGVENMMTKRRALLAVLASGPDDTERLSEALGELREASAAAQEQSHKVFLDVAASLPADKRAAFLKAAAEPRGRGRARDRDRK